MTSGCRPRSGRPETREKSPSGRGYDRYLIMNFFKLPKVGQWGPRNHNFKDGLSRATINRYSKRALKLVGRDLFTCEKCGRRGKVQFPRHHIDRNRANNNPDNLTVLCQSCHNVEHMKERDRDTLGRLLPK